MARGNVAAAIGIIALVIGAGAFILASRPQVVSQAEIASTCLPNQVAQNETSLGAIQCIKTDTIMDSQMYTGLTTGKNNACSFTPGVDMLIMETVYIKQTAYTSGGISPSINFIDESGTGFGSGTQMFDQTTGTVVTNTNSGHIWFSGVPELFWVKAGNLVHIDTGGTFVVTYDLACFISRVD